MKSRARTRRARSRFLSSSPKIAIVVIAVAAAILAFVKLSSDRGLFRAQAKTPTVEDVPQVDTAVMERRVRQLVENSRQDVLANLSSAKAWGRYAIVLDAHEIYDAAVSAYRIAYALDPKDYRWPYFLSRAIKFTGGDDSSEIVPFYEAAIKLRPDYAPIHVRYGDSLLRLNRVEDARKAYERALKLEPSLWVAHRGMGQALIQAGEGPEAIKHLEMAVTNKPDDGASFAALARAYLLAGEQEKAAVAAAKSQGLSQIHTFEDPALAEIGMTGISSATCIKRARELMTKGRYQEALQNLKIAEEVLKDRPVVFQLMGMCYERLGQREQAIEGLKRSLAIKNDAPDVHVKLGSLLVTSGRYSEAIGHFRESLSLADSALTRAHLAAALGHAGQLKESSAEFDRAVEGGAQLDADFQNNWGAVLAQQGLYLQAIPHFREATRLNPRLSSAYFNWGRALEDAGNPAEALRLFEIAARLDPKGPAVRRIHELTANTQDSG
jgi:tetratricopeptide (TPR) repeat protein